jgi:hypothetical protein
MGYLGSNATFTGTQNHNRVSEIALQGQTAFTVRTGYSINAIDVYRNGVRLVTQRDFSALDGVTVTLVEAANENDIIEFVTFENFKRDDVVGTDGDATIRGNLSINGNLAITGLLDASVTNTATAGFAQTAGISTQVSGYLGVGVTGYNLNLTGVATATSFSGSGANLTALNGSNVSSGTIAAARVATLNQDTTGTAALASGLTGTPNISCGTGAFSGDVTLQANLVMQDSDRIRLGTGTDVDIYHDGSNTNFDNYNGNLYIDQGMDDGSIYFRSDNGSGGKSNYIQCNGSTGAVILSHYGSTKLETASGGVDITGELECDSLDVQGNLDIHATRISYDTSSEHLKFLDNIELVFGNGDDLKIYHDATDNVIETDGPNIRIGTSGETFAKFVNNGTVELYYDNSKKIETASGGAAVTGSITATTFGTASQNAYGARTVQSGGSPSGGSDGDIYYIY